jgi:hypothetical protein
MMMHGLANFKFINAKQAGEIYSNKTSNENCTKQ